MFRGLFFQTNNYAAYLHDAILLYAYALNETLSEGVAITEGTNVSKSMIGKQFLGKHALHFYVVFMNIYSRMQGIICSGILISHSSIPIT